MALRRTRRAANRFAAADRGYGGDVPDGFRPEPGERGRGSADNSTPADERADRGRHGRMILPALALISALFFAAAIAYGAGSGLLLTGGDEAARGEAPRLPRDWANLPPLGPISPAPDDEAERAGDSGSGGDSRGRDGQSDPAGGASGIASGPQPRTEPVATTARDPRATSPRPAAPRLRVIGGVLDSLRSRSRPRPKTGCACSRRCPPARRPAQSRRSHGRRAELAALVRNEADRQLGGRSGRPSRGRG